MLTTILIIVVAIPLLLAIGNLLIVLLTYSIFWYEYANRQPQSFDNRFNWRNLLLIARLVLPEVIFNCITLLTLPFGLGEQRPALKKGVTPVILLNGLFVNRCCWFWFGRQLKKNGVDNLVALNLSGWHNEEALTEQLAKKVDELRHQLGVEKVNLLAHSMGGMIARNYIQLRGGGGKVDRLVCLAPPNRGSKLAPFSLTALGKILFPDSPFLQRLNSAPVIDAVQLTTIYSRKDNMVIPNSSQQPFWGETVELDNMGHTALLYRRSAIAAASKALTGERDNGQQSLT